MQVFGLPRHVIRSGCRGVTSIAATSSSKRSFDARRRRQALAAERWLNGLSATGCRRSVSGLPRSTLYRWEKAPEPKSRRPHRPRQPSWPRALVQAVEELRADNPMWGKRKLVWLLRREGFVVSVIHRRPHLEAASCTAAW